MTSTSLSATFLFADDFTRQVSFAPYTSSSNQVQGFKNRVKEFNSGAGQYNNFKQYFKSDDGASCTKIQDASIITTTKTVLFAKSAEYAYQATSEEGE